MESLLIEFANKGKQEDIEQLADYYYYTKQNMQLAEKPTMLLAEQGLAQYQSRLGMIYYQGIDEKPDYKKAYPWFLKAAEANDLNGKISVASFYLGGLGVQQDFEKAVHWFNEAYAQDPVYTCELLNFAHRELNNSTSSCTSRKSKIAP
ncbi:tetratricopeptide repeat protein [Acinetobacter amyesii]|uniref:tetratricopeptide repeat protein n=1 Tax=Acinetobacter amyesii TaxID=2942470 RepID=UPI003F0E48DA